jgi:WD40 repeat protein
MKIIIGLATGSFVILMIAIYAIVQWQRAEQQNKLVLTRHLTAQAQSILLLEHEPQETALLLAIQSMRFHPSGEAAQILQQNELSYPVSRMTWPTYRAAWEDKIYSISFSPNGKYVVSGGPYHTARVWDAFTGEEISRITQDGFVASVAVSPDNKYVVSGGESKTVRVWDIVSGQEISSMTHDHGGRVSFVTFSPNGKYVASSASYDETIHLWDAKTGQEVSLMSHDDDACAFFAFSPDSKLLVSSGGRDNTARVWDTSTGEEISRMTHDSGVSSVAFSPDSKYVASGGDNTARVWEAVTGKEIARMTHDSYVYFVSFSPDGKYIASGGHDSTARVWKSQTGQEIARFIHNDFVSYIAFSPDGTYVLSTERTGTTIQAITHVWNAKTGQEIFRMLHIGGKYSVSFSPDGKHIVSTSKKGDAILIRHYLPEDLIADACLSLTRNLTHTEWQNYIGSTVPYQATCPNLPMESTPAPVTSPFPTLYSTATP